MAPHGFFQATFCVEELARSSYQLGPVSDRGSSWAPGPENGGKMVSKALGPTILNSMMNDINHEHLRIRLWMEKLLLYQDSTPQMRPFE